MTPHIFENNVYTLPIPIQPRRHYNVPCRVYRCNSVMGLTNIDADTRNSFICHICYNARKKIVNYWKTYIYKKRLSLLLFVTHRLLKDNHIDINRLISRFLV